MNKILFVLLSVSLLFCGCSGNINNQKPDDYNPVESRSADDEINNEGNYAQKQVLYPANNYVGNSFVAENDRYIAYTNHDGAIAGVYLYDKAEKTTAKINDDFAYNLVVGADGVYFDDAGRLKRLDFFGENLQEIVDELSMLTSYDGKIYYSSYDDNLYEFDMASNSVKLIARGEEVFTEPDMSTQFQNICIGDRIYFTSSIEKNGERVAVLMALNTDGSADRIHECISLVNLAVYDRGFLYFEDKNGLARVKADGNGLEERLVPRIADGESCDNFYVYNGKWYYQKYTRDRSRLFCMNSADDDEQILLDLNSPEFGGICAINQTEDYIFFIMTDPDVEANHYNYLVWVYNRNDFTVRRLGENFE